MRSPQNSVAPKVSMIFGQLLRARHLSSRPAAGRLRVIVDRVFPLAEAADAHAYVESRQAVGRVVLVP